MDLNGTNLTMTRGDTEELIVSCSDPFRDGDEVAMTVRESADSPVEFQKIVREFSEEGKAVIVIDHEDTEGMNFGTFLYDIQITREDGEVKTPVKPSKFTLTEEITY